MTDELTAAYQKFVVKALKPVKGEVRNCKSCAHRYGGLQFAKCLKVGYYIEAQRKYPSRECDSNFSGWERQPKPWWRFW
jgi:hypothetical protein